MNAYILIGRSVIQTGMCQDFLLRHISGTYEKSFDTTGPLVIVKDKAELSKVGAKLRLKMRNVLKMLRTFMKNSHKKLETPKGK